VLWLLSTGPFRQRIIPIEPDFSETPLAALIDDLCAEWVYGRFPSWVNENTFPIAVVAVGLTLFFMFLPGRCNSIIWYVTMILMDASFMAPIMSSPSVAAHVVLIAGTFGMLDQVISRKPLTQNWGIFLGAAAILVVVNVALVPESAALFVPFAVAGLGAWESRFGWGIAAGVGGIAAAALLSYVCPWMPRWRRFRWDWRRILDDWGLARCGTLLTLVVFLAYSLKSTSNLRLSHRRIIVLLVSAIPGFALFPWVAGEQGAIMRIVAIQSLTLLVAGIVYVRHRGLHLLHRLFIGSIVIAWFARYRFRPLQCAFDPLGE
jgi:hypothetical protein